MNKRYDAYVTDEKKVVVYERGELGEYGELPDRKPVYEVESEDDEGWREWIESHTDWRDDRRLRICRRTGTFDAAYAKDLEAKAQELLDRYRAEGAKLGWGELYIDTSWTVYTYRASAAWKEQPTLYTFDQRLTWKNAPGAYGDTDALWARDNYVRLVGMADAAHELGVDLVFDEGFKVRLVGLRADWKAEYEI